MQATYRLLLVSVAFTTSLTFSPNTLALSAQNNAAIQHAQLTFEENRGQFLAPADYLLRGPTYQFALGHQPVLEVFTGTEGEQEEPTRYETYRLQLQLLGADPEAWHSGIQPSQTITNYMIGNNKNPDLRGIRSFNRVRYQDIYPGINVEYYVRDGWPEFDFVLSPGATLESIKLNFPGSSQLNLNEAGDIVIHLADHTVIQKAPVSYQVVDGHRVPVESSYVLNDQTVGFQVQNYDPALPLIIDPQIIYSGYHGGPGVDRILNTALDANDNIYLIGVSNSLGLATIGTQPPDIAQQRTLLTYRILCQGCSDAGISFSTRRQIIPPYPAYFITKLSPDAQQVIWQTFLYPGTERFRERLPNQVTSGVSSAGEVALAFQASPPDNDDPLWPLKNEVQTHEPSERNIYAAKFNTSGDDLVFGTYLHLGNNQFSLFRGATVSDSGKLALAGEIGYSATITDTFPRVNQIPGMECFAGIDSGSGDRYDGFITVFDEAGALELSSCIGGNSFSRTRRESLRQVDFSGEDWLFFTGISGEIDYPQVNAIQPAPTKITRTQLVLGKINLQNQQLEFSSFHLTDGDDFIAGENETAQIFPLGLSVDRQGGAVIVGMSTLTQLASHQAFQQNIHYPRNSERLDFEDFLETADYFITKVSTSPAKEIFTSYLGGSDNEFYGAGITTDLDSSIYLVGATESLDFPLVQPLQDQHSGLSQTTLSKLSPTGQLIFSTYLGGSNEFYEGFPGNVAINSQREIIVAYNTDSPDLATANTVNQTYFGQGDIALAIIGQQFEIDTDHDNVPDALDAFPSDPLEWRDSDGDGLGDLLDEDDDGDGVNDDIDHFPLDARISHDSDFDGAADQYDLFPNDRRVAYDLDHDGIGDYEDNDIDGDGVSNSLDLFITDQNESHDFDQDGIGDNSDLDIDGDGLPDSIDILHLEDNWPQLTFNRFDPFNANVRGGLPPFFTPSPAPGPAWTAASDEAFSGNISLSNLPIGDDESASIYATRSTPQGQLQFYYRVDSEADRDIFTFIFDGQEVLSASGQIGWSLFSLPVSNGAHQMEWRYQKDAQNKVGSDAAWIDDISIRPLGDLSITALTDSLSTDPGTSFDYLYLIRNTIQTDIITLWQLERPVGLNSLSISCMYTNGEACPNDTDATGSINYYLLDFSAAQSAVISVSGVLSQSSNTPLVTAVP